MHGKNPAPDGYHHGDLKAELIRLGLAALEREGAGALSLRALAAEAGVSKAAPYRHFPERELFLGALADEGFRLLCLALENATAKGSGLPGMGRAYMAFAVARPALYRLMNSELMCRMPSELTGEARRSMRILGAALAREALVGEGSWELALEGAADLRFADEAAAAWGYIHGLVMLRIDRLFPAWLPEPDWDSLAGRLPSAERNAPTPPRRGR